MAIGSIASQWDSEMRVSLRYRLEYAVVMTIRAVVRVLPRRVSLSFGTVVGGIFHLLHGRRRELAMSNLRMTFPKRTDFECRAILRATFAQLGRHCIDFLNFDAMEADEMLKLVEFEGEEYVENAIARGRGVMYFAGHFGAWELQIMVHAFRFQRIVMVARTLGNTTKASPEPSSASSCTAFPSSCARLPTTLKTTKPPNNEKPEFVAAMRRESCSRCE